MALLCWYAHSFPLLIALMLITIEATRLRATAALPSLRGASMPRLLWRYALHVGLPLLPAALLSLVSIATHLTEPKGAMTGFVETRKFLPAWELAYHLWAEWCSGFTWRTLTSFAVVAGGVWGLCRLREQVPFFSRRALVVLAVLFLVSPYRATEWFHLNSRFIPYVWLALLVRVPDRLPARVSAVLMLAAAMYSVGLGVEYRLLDRDRRAFVAALDAVPEHAKLLPLVFDRKGSSEHTQSLLHAWGYYVVEKSTSAPLLFAHSRGFPVMYSEPPPTRFNHLVLEPFAAQMRDVNAYCSRARGAVVYRDDCVQEYREAFTEFWDDSRDRYDTVLLWEPSDAVLASLPAYYEKRFQQGGAYVFARSPRMAETALNAR